MIDINNLARDRFDRQAVISVAERFLKKFKLAKKDLSLAFVSSQEMKRLNSTYRQKSGTTDVLSFDGEGDSLGEIVFDYKQIKKQAKELKHSAKYELLFILTHGLLHLIGHNDNTEKKRLAMIKEGEELLSQFLRK